MDGHGDAKSDAHNGTCAGLILSLGSINADFQMRVERRPELSETLVGSEFKRLGGGKAANVSFLARRLGCDTRLFGHVGADDLAEQALAPLRESGVNLESVARVEQGSTGVAMITVPPDGNKGIVLAANANQIWSDEDSADVERVITAANSESVLVVDCEVPIVVATRAARAASKRGCTVVLDPSPAERVDDELIALADLVTPNASEAKQLVGFDCEDPNSAVRAGVSLLESGAGAVCMKLPEGGCVLVEQHRATHVAAVPVEVVDTTGAGDAFAGALAVAQLEGFSPIDAVKFAVAASHLAVSGYGSQPAFPNRRQIQQMVKRIPVFPR